MPKANLMETIGAIFAGLITVAIAAVIFKPNSTTAAVLSAGGSSFATAVSAAEGNTAAKPATGYTAAMKWPTSISSGLAGGLRAWALRLDTFHAGAPSVNVRKGILTRTPQGTHAAQSMGHESPGNAGLNQWPTETQFSTDSPTLPVEGAAWTAWPLPPNPSIVINSPSPGRGYLFPTAPEQQAQPAPGRIVRMLPERVMGNMGPMFGHNEGSPDSFGGMETTWQYMPHMAIPRKAQGTKGPTKLSDDNAAIPALYAGNPKS